MSKITTYLTAFACLLPFTALAAVKEPKAFTLNCKVCHSLDQNLVGPSLIEIAKLYPRKKSNEFIQWCVEPGKKRQEMAQMPSMAHIPKAELKEIQAYILEVTKGKDQRMRVTKDLFKDSPSASARPRVTRTFLPKTGPASMAIALPTAQKHNLIWDTDQCRLRYISVGVVDNFPYLRSNGGSFAKVGDIVYTEEPLFDSKLQRQFKGYELTKSGFPILHYMIGKTLIHEEISVEENVITRKFTTDSTLPQFKKPESSKAIQSNAAISGNSLTISHKTL